MLQARRQVLMLGLSASLAGYTAAHSPVPATLGQALALPADPDAVVLRWHSTGGMLPTVDAAVLLIQANGVFSARARPGDLRRRTGQLSAQALQDLLVWIVEQQGFARLSGEAMLAEIRLISERSGRLFRLMDGGESSFEIGLPGLQHRVSFAALDAAFVRFPEVADLRRLHAIKQRLLNLANTAR